MHAELRSRVGMQSYRIEDGKLAETWTMFQPSGDLVAQDYRL
jgi:hypothetical protein